MIIKTTLFLEEDRKDEYAALAEKISNNEVITRPLHLTREERRLHIRNTLREDHTYRIKASPEDTKQKFAKLAGSIFDFFRGTALLFYRDYAGIDYHLPIVFTIGDVHPENFGVMPNENDVPFFGVNDFDEAYFAPFTYDIRRAVTGFYLSAKENGLSKKKRKKIVRSFISGYIKGLEEFAKDDREKEFQFRIDNSPAMIRKLLKNSKKSRKKFLKEKINLKKKTFRITDELVPYSKHLQEFQKVINKYVKENDIQVEGSKKSFFTVTDVAIKKGSGTASLGLDRYWVLLEGKTEAEDDCVILEMKQSRNSALTGLVPFFEHESKDEKHKAKKIVKAHSIHLVGGDKFYGYAEYDDKSYLVRERSPFKNDMDVDDLDAKSYRRYAQICGKTLAQTHARSDQDTGVMEGDAEQKILESIVPGVFKADMVRFAKTAAKRVKKDHKLYKKDYKIGAFEFVKNEQ